MNLTPTEKYAMAVLDTQGRLSSLQKRNQGLCLAASCVWDMIQANAVRTDEKGRLTVAASLPETLSYCSPVYEMLAQKPMKPERVVLNYIHTLTGKRIRALAESIADDLIDKSLLVVEQQSGLLKVRLCHVNTAVIMEDIEAVRHMDQAASRDQIILGVLLHESKADRKLLTREERSGLKKAVRQINSDFRDYIRDVKKRILGAEIIIAVCIAVAASQPLL